MRRLRVLSGLQVTNLPLKSPDRGKRLRAFNIHSTIRRFVREQVPHRGFQYARRVIQPRMLQTNE